MNGEFESCLCTVTGDIECHCVEQDVSCDPEKEEEYYEENCELKCSRCKSVGLRVCFLYSTDHKLTNRSCSFTPQSTNILFALTLQN